MGQGSEEGSAVIEVAPCTQDGKPLDEDYFVENPKELIGKPYHFMVSVLFFSIMFFFTLM